MYEVQKYSYRKTSTRKGKNLKADEFVGIDTKEIKPTPEETVAIEKQNKINLTEFENQNGKEKDRVGVEEVTSTDPQTTPPVAFSNTS